MTELRKYFYDKHYECLNNMLMLQNIILEDAKDEKDIEKDDKAQRMWVAYQHALISFQELVFFAKFLDGKV